MDEIQIQFPADMPEEIREMVRMRVRNKDVLPRDLVSEEHAILAADELRKRFECENPISDGQITPIGSILMKLSVNLFEPIMAHVVTHTLPTVRDFVALAVQSQDRFAADDLFRALGVLAWCRQREDVELIVKLATESFQKSDSRWSRVFLNFDSQHPWTVNLLNGFIDRLPGGCIDGMLLGIANNMRMRGLCSSHLFDSADGVRRLRDFLVDTSSEHVENACRAAEAIRWLRPELGAELLTVAERHPGRDVKVELAASKAILGDDEGVNQLIEFCLDPIFSRIARASLDDVGASERIPKRCLEADFEAMCEMNNWLCFPSEFGRPPAELHVVYSRKLFWPPADEPLHISLVRYVYRDVEPADIGIGCTGSTTFAIFGVPTESLSIRELLGLYCAHEGMDGVDLSDDKGVRVSIEAGLEWIQKLNGTDIE